MDDNHITPPLDQLDAWLVGNWDSEGSVGEWWALLALARLSAPTLPVDAGGRGWSHDTAAEALAAFERVGVLPPPAGVGTMLAAPTIAAHGSEEQRRRFLPRILDGRDGWCQLFSEPEAGSDLASLRTRAERDGDQWVVNGQKIWTSAGQYADWGMLLARTDPDAPKHAGITWFSFPMRQSGVDVRPLREMTGEEMFNEVFLDDARVDDSCRIGAVGDGWNVARTTLMVERASLGSGSSGGLGAAFPGSAAGHLERRSGDFVGIPRSAEGVTIGTSTVRQLAALARDLGRANDPVVRQELARLWSIVEVTRMLVHRAKAGGATTGGEGSFLKLLMSEAAHTTRDAGCLLLGAHAMVLGSDTPGGGVVQAQTLFSPATSIYGGTDEIQRNILGERVLGLPREPGAAKDTPFRDLPRSATAP